MRKLFLTLSAALVSFTCLAQITLENSYLNVSAFQAFTIEGVGEKYVMYDTMAKQFKIYNDNHAVYKTFNSAMPVGANFDYVWWAANKFVDGDNMIEIGYNYYVGVTPTAVIQKEDGSTVQTFAGCNWMQPRKMNGNWKLLVYKIFDVDVYDVVGTYAGIKASDNSTNQVAANLYPNPMSNAATLKYSLPEGVSRGTLEIFNTSGQKLRSYEVDRQFNDIIIRRGELPGGTYIYQLKAGDNTPVSKQFVVN